VALAGDATTLTLVAVAYLAGSGPTAMATLSPGHAERALEEARGIAREAGLAVATELLHGRDTGTALLDRAADADVLAVGAPTGSRRAGLAVGATATRVLHRSRVPVLAARRPPEGGEFPRRIVVATDGTPGSERAVQFAATIAVEHGADVALVHAGPAAADPQRRRMAEQCVELREATGAAPLWLDAPGRHAVDAIVAAARADRATLLLTGSRGVTGMRSLGSVSERVAHCARCSVLVVRPR
jgi:nucleotide-binding universal stress UspA family protein